MGKKPSRQACALCGKDPASGYAGVDGQRYCHGDNDPEPTCYMQAQRQLVGFTFRIGEPPFGEDD